MRSLDNSKVLGSRQRATDALDTTVAGLELSGTHNRLEWIWFQTPAYLQGLMSQAHRSALSLTDRTEYTGWQ